jgi:hypothetical protein
MVAQDTACLLGERDLRRQIDRSISRALVDGEYARRLLDDPTVVLDERDCRPQLYLSLLSIQAGTVIDFARQAQALFWAFNRHDDELVEQETLPLAAAAR